MTTRAAHAPTVEPASSEVVLEVPPEDREAYARHSYHDYMHVWNSLVRELAEARRTGDRATVERLTEELKHFWPRARAVASVAWVPDDDREAALPSERAR